MPCQMKTGAGGWHWQGVAERTKQQFNYTRRKIEEQLKAGRRRCIQYKLPRRSQPRPGQVVQKAHASYARLSSDPARLTAHGWHSAVPVGLARPSDPPSPTRPTDHGSCPDTRREYYRLPIRYPPLALEKSRRFSIIGH